MTSPRFKNLKVVPKLVFGRGCFDDLSHIMSDQRSDTGSFMVYLIDDVHEGKPLMKRLPLHTNDLVILVNVDDEPKTKYVDELTEEIRCYASRMTDGIVGIGGGSTMDLAKAVSIMLTNPGSSSDYQGWDLVRNPSVYHVGVPTLAGTGAEVSRTTVLTGPSRKLGINSDYTPFNQIVLDPDLLEGAPKEQRFYTAMDSFIHASEALRGTFLNTFSEVHARTSRELVQEVFLNPGPDADDKLMMASYLGGLSIAYSQVGVCHALSYGLSFVLGYHHGIGNCIVFNQLEEYYPEDVAAFREMLEKNNITLPSGVTRDVTDEQLDKMAEVSLFLEPLWQNALGPDWRKKMTGEKIRELFLRM